MLDLEALISALSSAVAVLIYLNTLPADFAFDDNFAVIYNGDVTNDGNPLRKLFVHDFWGQRISSDQSHKSYRPFTILSFRLARVVWQCLPKTWTRPIDDWRSQAERFGDVNDHADHRGRQRPVGLDPLIFHAANVLLHGVVTFLVTRLAYYLFRKRAQLAAQSASTPDARTATSEARPAAEAGANHTPVQGGGSGSHPACPDVAAEGSAPTEPGAAGLRRRTPAGYGKPLILVSATRHPDGSDEAEGRAVDALDIEASRRDQLSQVHLPCLLTGLAFALHPVHTEAVAGIVGHAELVCAAFSIPAMLMYFTAVDGSSSSRNRSGDRRQSCRGKDKGRSCARSAAGTCLLVGGAVLLSWAAALSKEIGITVLGIMMLYDLLLVPAPGMHRPGDAGAATGVDGEEEDQGAQAAAAAPGAAADGGLPEQGGSVTRALLLQVRWVRMLVLCAAGVLYVKVRGLVAGDQLVRIYRKVENPIAFSPSPLSRALSTLHLHARYGTLLVWPQHLSADWSFACIPLVDDLRDPRNALSLALYAVLLVVLVMARPWATLHEWFVAAKRQVAQKRPQASGATINGPLAVRRWRLLVLLGFVLAPFLPASNLLFYVGTFIGERLMYMPSIGYCILLGEMLATVLGWLDRWQGAGSGSGYRSWSPARKYALKSRLPAAVRSVARILVLSGCMAMLTAYGARTYLRNWDWISEEALFTSAQKVCWQSAKVQLNSGILERRRQDLPAALAHFKLARAIEPGYCEPDYWVGLTLVNLGRTLDGLVELESALGCKYVAADATRTLNTIYQAMHQAEPSNGLPMVRWGRVLLRPELSRLQEGCSTLESAALIYVQALDGPLAAAALDHCLTALQEYAHSLTGQSSGAITPSTDPNNPNLDVKTISDLRACVTARRAVFIALGNYGPRARLARQALYRYIRFVRKGMAVCRSDGLAAELSKPTGHMQLVHSIQSLDPNDPWLQLEWGEVMLVQGRPLDAARHLSAAGMLFFSLYAGGQKKEQQGTTIVTDLKGDQPLPVFESLVASAEGYERASLLGVRGVSDTSPCELRTRAVESRIAALVSERPLSSASLSDESASLPGLGASGMARRKAMAVKVGEEIGALAASRELRECRDSGQTVEHLKHLYGQWLSKFYPP